MIQLRGHHLFCLAGYRGMGYSKGYAENMTKIHRQLRNNPNLPIQLINGPDCLCEKYPENKEYHCENKNIFEQDETILKKLNLQIDQIITWKEVENRIMKYVQPSDIHSICATCHWKSYGYCEEGLQRICDGKGLKKVIPLK